MRAAEITGEIRALTGLRIVAAVWVVLFHFRPMLGDASPGFRDALAPVLDCGAQGVDLFFILSGFVLTWNYLDRMGRSWSVRANLHFLWLRLARVWPVYLVTLHLAAVWVIFTLHVGHVPSPEAGQLTAISYVRQILLVQLWFQPMDRSHLADARCTWRADRSRRGRRGPGRLRGARRPRQRV